MIYFTQDNSLPIVLTVILYRICEPGEMKRLVCIMFYTYYILREHNSVHFYEINKSFYFWIKLTNCIVYAYICDETFAVDSSDIFTHNYYSKYTKCILN